MSMVIIHLASSTVPGPTGEVRQKTKRNEQRNINGKGRGNLDEKMAFLFGGILGSRSEIREKRIRRLGQAVPERVQDEGEESSRWLVCLVRRKG